MDIPMQRRDFLQRGIQSSVGLAALTLAGRRVAAAPAALPFQISLAQWSLHKSLFGRSGNKLDNLDFAKVARSLDIGAVEYVNQFFKDRARDKSYLEAIKRRADDFGVKNLLIMIDGEGRLARSLVDGRSCPEV